MNKVVVLTLLAASLFACRLNAEEKGEDAKPAPRPVAVSLLDLLKQLDLTEEQKENVNELTRTFSDKVKEVQGKMDAVLTDVQKRARDETIKSAVEAGEKDRAKIAKSVSDAIKLTDEQKAKMKELNDGIVASQREMVEKIKALLTSEQAEQLKALIENAAKEKAA
jgi:hypothetical protein